MSKQAMELAIDECRDNILNGRGALEAVLDGDQTNADLSVFDDMYAALKEAIKQKGAPVAWIATDFDGHADVGLTKEQAKARAGEYCNEFIPLYTSAPTIPEGCQLVPKVMTSNMIEAFHDTVTFHIEYGEDVYVDNDEAVYKAMLSAAPEHKGEQQC